MLRLNGLPVLFWSLSVVFWVVSKITDHFGCSRKTIKVLFVFQLVAMLLFFVSLAVLARNN